MISPVRKMFDGIAKRYDFLNHFLSCFRDVAWRKSCCQMLRELWRRPTGKSGLPKLLDLCGGTGDFAITFERVVGCSGTPVIGDFSYGMLAEAPKKMQDAFAVQCDAMKMPFPDESFDVILNGFGMRNLPDAKGGLEESYRVLNNGGYLCVLEFFSPRGFFNQFFYKVLAPIFIPVMGAFFSGKRDAYVYLVNSIVRFLPVTDFIKLAENVGFELMELKEFDFGISYGVILRKKTF